jgi:hypothetical protein
MEKNVPHALLQASIFPHGTPTLEIISYLSKAKLGKLSEELGQVEGEVGKGASVEEALYNFEERWNSQSIGKLASLLRQGEKSGADLSKLFKEVAEDLLEVDGLARDRKASLLIEKFTLLAAAGIVVPLVLGIVGGIVQGFDLEAVSSLSLGGLDIFQRKKLLRTALDCSQVYLVEFVFLSSLFLGLQENDWRKGVVFAFFLLPLALSVYFLIL